MKDLETLRQAQLLLGQYGFEQEQEAVGKAIHIISATAKRLGAPVDGPRTGRAASVGERLTSLRERAGLTRGQVAELCGVILNTVRAHENGEVAISAEAADAYARALGVTRGMVLNGRD